MKSKTTIWVVLAFIVLTLVFTHPLAANMTSRLPDDLGDPLFNTWVVNWDIHALLSDPADILNANIFHPYKKVLAYSDLMIAPAILGIPAKLLTGNPIFTYNFIFLVLMVLAATAMHLLVTHLTRSPVAGFVAGCLYAFSAYRFAEAGHLQLMTDFFIPLGFLFAHRYLERRRLRDLIFLAVTVALQAASAWYYAIYLVLALAIFFAVMLAAKRLPRRLSTVRDLAVATVLLIVFIASMARPYLELNKTMPGFVRSIDEAANFSARPADYLVSMPDNLVIGPLSRPFLRDRERVLFPGVATIIFAVVTFMLAVRKNRDPSPDSGEAAPPVDRAGVTAYGLIALTALTLSAGPYFTRSGRRLPLPFSVFFEHVPGFRAMRVPARFGLLVLFSLVVIAGWGVAAAARWLKRRWPELAFARVVVVIACVALLVLQTFWGLALSEPIVSGKGIPAVYRWLSSQDKPGAIVELPMEPAAKRYIYFSTYHWKPLVNGYSGYFPPLNQDILNEMKDFPSQRSILVLQALGVDGALVHDAQPELLARIAQTPQLSLAKKIGWDSLYSVRTRRLPAQPGSLTLSLDAKSAIVSSDQVTLSMEVINSSNKTVVVPPRLQPVLSVWADGALLSRRVSYLPLILSPGQKAQVQLTLPPTAAGRRKIDLSFDSQVIRTPEVTLNLGD